MKKEAMDQAIQSLLNELDRTPRMNWHNAIYMALSGACAVGHAEGYKLGEQDALVKVASAPTLSINNHGPIVLTEGEDKALVNDKPTPEEEAEDRGFAILKDIARQLGGVLPVGSKVKVQTSDFYQASPVGGLPQVMGLRVEIIVTD